MAELFTSPLVLCGRKKTDLRQVSLLRRFKRAPSLSRARIVALYTKAFGAVFDGDMLCQGQPCAAKKALSTRHLYLVCMEETVTIGPVCSACLDAIVRGMEHPSGAVEEAEIYAVLTSSKALDRIKGWGVSVGSHKQAVRVRIDPDCALF